MQEVWRARDRSLEQLSHSESIEATDFLPANDLRNVIDPFQPLFANYSLFGLACDDTAARSDYHQNELPLEHFARWAARDSGGHALLLMPQFEGTGVKQQGQTVFDILDPFPGLSQFVDEPALWPGVLLWSRSGATTVAPQGDIE
jgi:hypothetical protein